MLLICLPPYDTIPAHTSSQFLCAAVRKGVVYLIRFMKSFFFVGVLSENIDFRFLWINVNGFCDCMSFPAAVMGYANHSALFQLYCAMQDVFYTCVIDSDVCYNRMM